MFVVTGASSGLGFAITCHLFKHNAAKIITLSSREESVMKAIEQLKSWCDTSRLMWHRCDLNYLRQVDRVARKLKDEEKRIDGKGEDETCTTSTLLTIVFSTSTNLRRMV